MSLTLKFSCLSISELVATAIFKLLQMVACVQLPERQIQLAIRCKNCLHYSHVLFVRLLFLESTTSGGVERRAWCCLTTLSCTCLSFTSGALSLLYMLTTSSSSIEQPPPLSLSKVRAIGCDVCTSYANPSLQYGVEIE